MIKCPNVKWSSFQVTTWIPDNFVRYSNGFGSHLVYTIWKLDKWFRCQVMVPIWKLNSKKFSFQMFLVFRYSLYSGNPKTGQIRISDAQFWLGPCILKPDKFVWFSNGFGRHFVCIRMVFVALPFENGKSKSSVLECLENRTVQFSDPHCTIFWRWVCLTSPVLF
jgi:hypothetical protein